MCGPRQSGTSPLLCRQSTVDLLGRGWRWFFVLFLGRCDGEAEQPFGSRLDLGPHRAAALIHHIGHVLEAGRVDDADAPGHRGLVAHFSRHALADDALVGRAQRLEGFVKQLCATGGFPLGVPLLDRANFALQPFQILDLLLLGTNDFDEVFVQTFFGQPIQGCFEFVNLGSQRFGLTLRLPLGGQATVLGSGGQGLPMEDVNLFVQRFRVAVVNLGLSQPQIQGHADDALGVLGLGRYRRRGLATRHRLPRRRRSCDGFLRQVGLGVKAGVEDVGLLHPLLTRCFLGWSFDGFGRFACHE